MEFGHFINEGKEFEITTPVTPAPWINALFNDEYYLEPDQTLQGEGMLVENYNRQPLILGKRYFYIKDRESKRVWNPNYVPLGIRPDEYSYVCGWWENRLTSVTFDVLSSIRVMVPENGTKEIWSLRIQNNGEEKRELSLYTMFNFYDHGVMGGECYYEDGIIYKYAFPYHALYEEKEKAMEKKAYTYMFSDVTPTCFEMSKLRFMGGVCEAEIPRGVLADKMDGIPAEAEDFCGVFSFDMVLLPGEAREVFIELGAAHDKEEIIESKKSFDEAYVSKKRVKLEEYVEERTGNFHMDTPDENLNAFGNYWLQKQMTLLTRQNRGSSYCPVRNQIQDGMGYAMINPKEAKEYIIHLLTLQQSDGFVQQWYDTNGAPPRALCLLRHTDAPAWLVICTEALIRQLGDEAVFDTVVPYKDGRKATVLEHLVAALNYLQTHLGAHGLCLIGDGDWNDPMNGVGREGKGESVWLSMAYIFAVNKMLPYLSAEERIRFEKSAFDMKDAINRHAWCNDRYAAAIHDDGTLLGDDSDRLFLNTQSWALMAGVPSKEREEKLLESVKRELYTPFGPLLLYPPFKEWDPKWGRISIKKSGTTENGSVYNHASMFYAYALSQIGANDELYETLWRTLPTNPENPPKQNTQNPIYLSNYYYGLKESKNYGRSSRHIGTGTVSWMLLLIIEEMLGVKATVDGLVLEPKLPSSWKTVKCTRRYKNSVYNITVNRGNMPAIIVDGRPILGNRLPYSDNKTYNVFMTI